MKTIILISLLIVFLFSCEKVKTDNEKMMGTWKRDLIDGMTGNILSTDTVLIKKNQIIQNNITYNYYLNNGNIYFYQTNDTSSYCYNFFNENQFSFGCFISPGDSYTYLLNKIL
jgi:hypothetical protein